MNLVWIVIYMMVTNQLSSPCRRWSSRTEDEEDHHRLPGAVRDEKASGRSIHNRGEEGSCDACTSGSRHRRRLPDMVTPKDPYHTQGIPRTASVSITSPCTSIHIHPEALSICFANDPVDDDLKRETETETKTKQRS